MNLNEARMNILNYISDVLFDLADDPDLSPGEREEVRDAMGDAADMLMDSLDLQVVQIEDDGTFVVHLFPQDPG